MHRQNPNLSPESHIVRTNFNDDSPEFVGTGTTGMESGDTIPENMVRVLGAYSYRKWS